MVTVSLLAGLLSISAAAVPAGPVNPGERCVLRDFFNPARCVRHEGPVAPRHRFGDSHVSQVDMKKDAMAIDPTPCRLVGHQDCPKKGKPIWRLGEPVEETLMRSFLR